ncbi:MAG TPA: Lrp/AsnC family transcriptional regulator [Thermoplasmata archaeon]|jgi:DNA-binding Lrp family transcriptional regulator
MDETDLSIVDRLAEDARKSFRRIAKELGISPDTVINRYTALREQGAIRGSTVVIDPKRIGYQAMAAFMIDTAPAHTAASESTSPDLSLILEKLIRMPNIIMATKTIGDHDILALIVARDFEHLISLRDSIMRIPGIKDLQASFWVKKTEICPKYLVV